MLAWLRVFADERGRVGRRILSIQRVDEWMAEARGRLCEWVGWWMGLAGWLVGWVELKGTPSACGRGEVRRV